MNYLAHAYLSFGDPEILAGNIFSDFVKGKKKFDFPKRIQSGITLHRAIDSFTDDHPVTAKAKQFFRSAYGLYAAAFVDVVFDHFLARDGKIFSLDELKTFADSTYAQLHIFKDLFPERFSRMFPYMQSQNWLYNYYSMEGIFSSFGGLVHRATYMHDPQPACDLFILHYEKLQQCYEDFFPLLKKFVIEWFSQQGILPDHAAAP